MPGSNRNAPTPVPPLQPLLFWQTGSLALVTGILGARFPEIALTLFVVLSLVDSRSWKPARLAFLLLCLCAGWWMGQRAEYHRPQTFPLWLEQSLEARKAVRITGEIVSVDGLSDRRLRVILRQVRPEPDENQALPEASSLLPGHLKWTWEAPPGTADKPRPIPGQQVCVSLKIRPVIGFRNTGLSNLEAYWERRNVFFQTWSKGESGKPVFFGEPSPPARLREALRHRVAVALRLEPGTAASDKGNGRGVLPALLFGDRFYLATADSDRVTAAGLAHSLALSGQHLTVVGLGALALVIGIGLACPGIFLWIPAFRLLALLSIPLAGGYLWLGNAPPSLVRAAIMLVVWCLFRGCAGGVPHRIWQRMTRRNAAKKPLSASDRLDALRNSHPERLTALAFPDALLVALTCMVLLDPLCIYDLGVQLSFTAVAGLALAAPLLHRLWLQGPLAFNAHQYLRNEIPPVQLAGKRCLRFLWLTLGCSLAAQVATLPLTLDAFGRTTLWFPTNLLWLPVLGFVVLPLAFLGLIGVAAEGFLYGLGQTLLELAALPCDWLFQGLIWLQHNMGMDSVWGLRPHWTGLAGFSALLVAAALLVGRKRPPDAAKRLCFIGLLLILIGPLLRLGDGFSTRVTLRILDVGQGQALLLEWPARTQTQLVRAQTNERTRSQPNDSETFEQPERFGTPGIARALIDGGGFFSDRFDSGRDILTPILTANRPLRLDFIALSHPDQDHLRGLLFIGRQFTFDAAFTAPLPGIDAPGTAKPLAAAFASLLENRGIPRHQLHAGDRLLLWSNNNVDKPHTLYLEVLAPAPDVVPTENNGLIFRLVYKERGLALLPGDAEAPYLRTLLHSGTELTSEVLVLPHHGSAGSRVPALYDAVQPRLAIASAGAFNAFRLPSWRVRKELENRDIPLRVTADEGEIVLSWELE